METLLSLWPFPVIILAAFLIAWGAECGQFYVSQGLALAALAWMQTLPEFAVEATIAQQAARDPSMMHLVTANFTGSLRLFVGLGWPLVFFIGYFLSSKNKKNRVLHLMREDAIAIVAFLPSLFYMLCIYVKSTLTVLDGLILFAIYGLYLFWLSKMPKQEMESLEDLGGVPKAIMKLGAPVRAAAVIGCLILGVAALFFCAHPFLNSMLHIALAMGISQFIFVQWIAPALSELPEEISAFYWAKTNRGAMGLVNFVSSCVNQWTMLIGMIPFIVMWSSHGHTTIVFDDFQKAEILLTVLQGFLGMMFLLNMEFHLHEAAGLMGLWIIQFVFPASRHAIVYVYGGWLLIEILAVPFRKRQRNAFVIFAELTRERVWTRKSL